MLLIWIIVGHESTMLAVSTGGCRLDILSLPYHFLFLAHPMLHLDLLPKFLLILS